MVRQHVFSTLQISEMAMLTACLPICQGLQGAETDRETALQAGQHGCHAQGLQASSPPHI